MRHHDNTYALLSAHRWEIQADSAREIKARRPRVTGHPLVGAGSMFDTLTVHFDRHGMFYSAWWADGLLPLFSLDDVHRHIRTP